MKKRIIALVLALTLAFSVLPTAFAANVGITTEGKKPGNGVRHVDDDIVYYKQLIIDELDYCMAEFPSKNNYCAAVWNEAQQLYKDECARVMNCTKMDELIMETFFGAMPNEKTMLVCMQLEGMSALTKYVVTKADDLQRIKADLKDVITSQIEYYYPKEDLSDFYLDKVTSMQEEAFDEIDAADTFAAYVMAQSTWSEVFTEEPIDPEYASVNEYLMKVILNKDEIADLTDLLSDELTSIVYDIGEKIKDMDDDTYDELWDIIDDFYDKSCDAPYARLCVKYYYDAVEEIYSVVDLPEEPEREAATNSYIARCLKKLEALFDKYDINNYYISSWYDLWDIYDDAAEYISSIEYKDEFDDEFLAGVKEQMDAVPTYQEQLKSVKADCIAEIKSYVGNKKFNQKTAKPLATKGVNAIKASKDIGEVYTLYGQYIDLLEKTINIYKMTVTKSGKGSVTKSKTVKYGANFTVKIVPAAGYKIKSIVVDGKKVKLTNAYTFKKVVKAHTIKVTFGK